MNTTSQTSQTGAVQQSGYQVKIDRDCIRVVSVFNGTKTASQVIHEAAVKKILYDASGDEQQGHAALLYRFKVLRYR